MGPTLSSYLPLSSPISVSRLNFQHRTLVRSFFGMSPLRIWKSDHLAPLFLQVELSKPILCFPKGSQSVWLCLKSYQRWLSLTGKCLLPLLSTGGIRMIRTIFLLECLSQTLYLKELLVIFAQKIGYLQWANQLSYRKRARPMPFQPWLWTSLLRCCQEDRKSLATSSARCVFTMLFLSHGRFHPFP